MKKTIPLFALITSLSISAQDAKAIHPAPKYSTLLGQGLSGSGFHYKTGDKRYLACSLHQFKGKAPTVMASMDFDEVIKVEGRVYTVGDIQVLTYKSAELDKQEPLKFDPDVTPLIGDKVYCYNFEDAYEGRIISVAPDNRNYTIKMSKLYPAAGNSGSPVVSATTGTVIGVVLSANHPDKANEVGFELLRQEKRHHKPHHPTARSRSFSMISGIYNLNTVIHFRRRS